MIPVYQGAVAPEAYRLQVTQGDSGVDLATVTTGEFRVCRADGQEVVWSATVGAQSATSLILTHTYAGGDLPVAGVYVIHAALTHPLGVSRSKPKKVLVLNPCDPSADP